MVPAARSGVRSIRKWARSMRGAQAKNQVRNQLGRRGRELQARAPVSRGHDQVGIARHLADVWPRVNAPRPQAGPCGLEPGLAERRAQEDGFIEQAAHGAGSAARVKAGLLFGCTDQHPPVAAWDEVVLAMLDDPREERPILPQEHDLTLDGRRGRVHAQRPEQPLGPRTGRQDHPVASDLSRTRANRADPVAARLEAIDGVPGKQPHAALRRRGGQRPHVPGVPHLGAVGQEIDRPQFRVQRRLDLAQVGGSQLLMDDSLHLPAAGAGEQLLLLAGRPGNINSPAAPIAVIDAGLFPQCGGPAREELGAPGPEPRPWGAALPLAARSVERSDPRRPTTPRGPARGDPVRRW